MALPSADDPPTLENLLIDCGVSQPLTNSLIQAGWTLEAFSSVTESVSEFDNLWTELFPEIAEIPLLQKAHIKSAWKRLQRPIPQHQVSNLEASSSDTSWNDLHAPKLSASVVSELKRAYLQHYPSEVLTADTCPSARLLALVHAQVQKKDIRWIPWKYRMSQQRMEDLQMARPPKLARTESATLSQLLLDDPPSIDVTNQNMGLNGMRVMLELVNTAYALVQGAHLGRLRAYSVKFLGLISNRLEADTGLRQVTPLEAQAADRHLWGLIHELTSDKGWTLNDSLHEITLLRSDMMGLLQPRPRQAPRPPASDVQSLSSKGKGRGKSKGKTRSAASGPRWVSEITIQGKRQSICMRYQTGACHNSQCRFKHVCAIPKPDGTACGGNHSAKDHESISH